MSTSSKPVLYVFGPSVWAKPPELALVALGYPKDTVEKKTVNLATAENLSPEFVKISKPATLPVLQVNGETYTSTIDVVRYLVSHSPSGARPTTHQDLIDLLHEDSIDPNFPFVGARSKAELDAKRKAFPGEFVRTRYENVVKFNSAADGELKAYYATKLPTLGYLNSIYTDASAEQVEEFIRMSIEHMQRVNAFITSTLPQYLPETGFVDGENGLGEADFHLAAWLARIALLDGASDGEGMKAALEKEVGQPLDAKLVRYLQALGRTEAFRTVYADGLH